MNQHRRCCGGLFYATSLTSRSEFLQKSLVNEAMHALKELTLQLIDVFNAGFQDLFALVVLQQVFKAHTRRWPVVSTSVDGVIEHDDDLWYCGSEMSLYGI